MKRAIRASVLVLYVTTVASTAFAQTQPAARPVPIQPKAAPAAKAGPPPVAFCKKRDITGIWKLKRIFETPVGNVSAEFKQNPHQYVWFKPNNVYHDKRGVERFTDRDQARQGLQRAAGNVLTQYVIGEKGALYTYRDRVSTGGNYCGIVQKDQPPYRKGDMVLTPFEVQSGVSIFYLYRRPFAGQPTPAK